MAGKTKQLNLRVDEELAIQAESLYTQLGLNLSNAISAFLSMSLRVGGMPFELRVEQPNALTLAAMKEADDIASGALPAQRLDRKDVEAFFRELMDEDEDDDDNDDESGLEC